jgi:hypothetical protein
MRTLELHQRNAMRAAVVVAVSAMTACATVPPPAIIPGGRVTESRANVARGAATAEQDENIRVATGVNVRGGAGEEAPAAKAPEGTVARGGLSCQIRFDNRSTLHIATYADGTYRGALGPWGDIYTYVIAGPTRLYARATFTDGSATTWGPTMVDCPAGDSFTWRLYFQ